MGRWGGGWGGEEREQEMTLCTKNIQRGLKHKIMVMHVLYHNKPGQYCLLPRSEREREEKRGRKGGCEGGRKKRGRGRKKESKE